MCSSTIGGIPDLTGSNKVVHQKIMIRILKLGHNPRMVCLVPVPFISSMCPQGRNANISIKKNTKIKYVLARKDLDFPSS